MVNKEQEISEEKAMKTMRRVLSLLLVLMMTASIAACGNTTETKATTTADVAAETTKAITTDATAAGNTDKTYNIVYIPKSIHEFYNLVKEGVDKGITELEAKGVKVNLTWSASQKADPAAQADLLEAAIATKPDAIAIAVIDGDLCKDLMQKAIDQGIVVIGFDTDFTGSPRQACVGAGMDNQYKCGQQMADMIVEAMGTDTAKIALLTGSPSAENHKIIVQGFQDRVKEAYPNLNIVSTQADNDSLETATSITESIFSQYPDIKGIVGVTSSDGLGAAKAYQTAVASGQFKVGDVKIIDKTLTAEKRDDMIPNGFEYGVMDCPPVMIGYYSIMMLNAYLTDGTAFQDVYLPYEKVTAENVTTFTTDYQAAAADMEYWNK